MLKTQSTYQKYGYWSLLLSWVPIIGDPITLIAGLLKENFTRFILIVSIAKIDVICLSIGRMRCFKRGIKPTAVP